MFSASEICPLTSSSSVTMSVSVRPTIGVPVFFEILPMNAGARPSSAA